MPHLSLCSPLPLDWAVFKKDGNGDSIASRFSLTPPPPPPPPRLCVCLFLSDTSCCFFCTVCDAAWEGLWRNRNPSHYPLVVCSRFLRAASVSYPQRSLPPPPPLLLPPQPQLPFNLQRCLERGARVTEAEVWETQPEKPSSPFYFHN